jgi:tol-pal system protein YbgF
MNRRLCFCLLLTFGFAQLAALAGTKEEMMRLQNDILTLQNQIREFEKIFGEKMDGLKSLVVQLQDEVANSGVTLRQVAGILDKQASGVRSADQTVLQEIRALSTKMDESATRISALAQQVNELKVQYKSLEQQETTAAKQSPDDLYNQAMRDFVQENFDLTIQEFTDYASNYPGGEKAASALYYVGEAYRRQKLQPQAAAAFTRVINEYPGTGSVASALFKRALTELDMQDKEKAIADFKALVEKYPDTSEAAQAKAELQKIEVKPAPKPVKKAPARKAR